MAATIAFYAAVRIIFALLCHKIIGCFNLHLIVCLLLFFKEKGECDFNMDWRTYAACPERKEINCTANGTFGHYDLTPLKNTSSNYEVSINSTYSIIFNVCHTVLYGRDTCLSKNGACLLDKRAEDKK